MSVSGKDILLAVYEAEEKAAAEAPDTATGALARSVGLKDGRSIAHRLHRLERAGLLKKVGRGYWATSFRGRQLSVDLIAADATRGGKFRPYSEFTTLRERLALSHR